MLTRILNNSTRLTINKNSASKIIDFKNTELSTNLKFQPGEILKGHIINKFPNGEVLISSNGKKFIASTELELKEGYRYIFQVKSSDSKTILKVLGQNILKLQSPLHIWASTAATRNKLTQLLNDLSKLTIQKNLSSNTIQLLEKLRKLFPSFIYSGKILGDAKWLESMLTKSGIFWENKVALLLLGGLKKDWQKLAASDLKGLLLLIEKELNLKSINNSNTEPLLAQVREAISLIEQEQSLNLSSLRDGLGWFMFIRGWDDKDLKRAEIFVNKEKKDGQLCLSIFLDFSWLGKMKADITLIESSICIKIYLKDGEKIEFLENHLNILKENLSNAGLMVNSISCEQNDMDDYEVFPLKTVYDYKSAIHLVI